MAKTKLKDHKGTAIYVDEHGVFSATIGRDYGAKAKTVSRKDLRAVEREIEAAIPKGKGWPGIDLFSWSPSDRHPHESSQPDKVHVAGVRAEKRRGYTSTKMVDEHGRDFYGYGSYYRYDPVIIQRLMEVRAEIVRLQHRENDILAEAAPIGLVDVANMVDDWEQGAPSQEATA